MVSVDESLGLLGSVYWKFHENFFISLTGKVLNFSKKEKIEISLGVLEENSAKNLMKLFTFDSINSATNSPNDPLRSLVESLVRLGKIGIEKLESEKRNKDNDIKDDIDNSNHINLDIGVYEIYFQCSVVVGGKKEFPLYILKTENFELEKLFDSLKTCSNFDEKSNFLQGFYLNYEASIELEIFKKPKFYELLYEPIESIEKMIKSLRSDGIRLSDLVSEYQEDLDLKDLENIFSQILSTKIPSEKLSNLVKFQSSLTQKQQETNADILLPLLTYALIYLENGS